MYYLIICQIIEQKKATVCTMLLGQVYCNSLRVYARTIKYQTYPTLSELSMKLFNTVPKDLRILFPR